MASSADPLLDRSEARIGQSLRGKWTLDRLLGVGGMAAVFAATHRNGLRGAVKILHQELNAIEEIRKRFLREGYVANKVGHPGAVRVLDDDVAEDGSVFLVMELLEGQTVEALATSRPDGRLSVGEVLAIAEMTLETLAAAHDRGIVHRDLKPENLFVTKLAELRVLDFGIARLREVSASKGNSFPTMAGATLGTPGFMPPEQARGSWSEVDARADIWALGATLFTVLAGRRVHEGPTPLHVLAVSVTSPAPELASVIPDVPEAVAAVIDRALAFEPRARWQSARAMLASVRAARLEHPFTFTPTDIGEVEAVARVHNTMPLAPEALPATAKPSTPPPTPPPELSSGERPTVVRPAATLLPHASVGMADPVSSFDDFPTNDDTGYPPTLKGSDLKLRGGLAPPESRDAALASTRRANLAVILGAAIFILLVIATSVWLASHRADDSPPRGTGTSHAP